MKRKVKLAKDVAVLIVACVVMLIVSIVLYVLGPRRGLE